MWGQSGQGHRLPKHTVRTAAAIARKWNCSLGVLFSDVASAFCRMLRQLCLPSISTEEELAIVVRELKFPPETLREIRAALLQEDAATQAGIPEPLINYLNDKHSCTWFVPAGSNSTSITACNTLPGSPFANVAYDLLAKRVLDECEAELDARGLLTSLPAATGRRIACAGREAAPAERVNMSETSFVDDNAFFVFTERPEELRSKVGATAQTIDDVFATHGLSLGYGASKTAVAIVMRGKGAPAARRQAMLQQEAEWAVEAKGVQEALAMVPAYVHLGESQCARSSVGPALSKRAADVQGALRPLRKRLLYDRRPSNASKQLFTNGFVGSVLKLGVATWPRFCLREQAKFDALHARVRRDAVGLPSTAESETHAAQVEVRAAHPTLQPMEMIRCERLAYLQRPLRHGPRQLSTMLHEEQGWWEMVVEDLRWTRRRMWLVMGLPDPQCEPEPCEDIISHANGTTCRTYVRRFRKLLGICNQSGAYIELSTRRLRKILGLAADEGDTEVQQRDFVCLECSARFATHAALATHCYGKQRKKAEERRLTASVTCAACLKNFYSRRRIVTHLVRSKKCAEHLRLRPSHALSQQEADELDRVATKESTALRDMGFATGGEQLPVVWAAGPKHDLEEVIDNMTIFEYAELVGHSSGGDTAASVCGAVPSNCENRSALAQPSTLPGGCYSRAATTSAWGLLSDPLRTP